MLAADELRPGELPALRATGYLARNYFLFNRNQWMDETVEHVAKGFLGLTMNCAKCHDHKYDPITQVDYYRMRAIFEPYHVRVDMVPGEADLTRDGIPRAFDGLLDVPTYRFIRGQENRPDKSSPVRPAIPTALAFEPIKIHSVELPAEAWQPERRQWVADAYRLAARRQIAGFEAKIGRARNQFDLAEHSQTGPEPCEPITGGDRQATTIAVIEARLELQVAELGLAAARAELQSVERRVEAMRAAWNRSSCGKDAGPASADLGSGRHARRSRGAGARGRSRAGCPGRGGAPASPRGTKQNGDNPQRGCHGTRGAREGREGGRGTDRAVHEATRMTMDPDPLLELGKGRPGGRFPAIGAAAAARALAEWITDRRNPLTARVAVNHLWARHLGTPLVATVFDFGRKGSPHRIPSSSTGSRPSSSTAAGA